MHGHVIGGVFLTIDNNDLFVVVDIIHKGIVMHAKFDKADMPLIEKYELWITASKRGPKNRTYYIRSCLKEDGIIKKAIHRVIMNAQKGQLIDHINHDGLDNRRCNLRICTHTQNNINRRKFKGASVFKGVSWCTRLNRWRAQIRPSGCSIYLGYFKHEKDAARAYNEKAKEMFGEFACLNNIED